MIPHRFKVDLPNELVIAIAKAKDNKEVKEIGINWCIQQSKDLMKTALQFFIIILWEKVKW